VTSQVQKKEKEIEAMMVLLGIEAQGSRKIKNQWIGQLAKGGNRGGVKGVQGGIWGTQRLLEGNRSQNFHEERSGSGKCQTL